MQSILKDWGVPGGEGGGEAVTESTARSWEASVTRGVVKSTRGGGGGGAAAPTEQVVGESGAVLEFINEGGMTGGGDGESLDGEGEEGGIGEMVAGKLSIDGGMGESTRVTCAASTAGGVLESVMGGGGESRRSFTR